jgi:hypothetical protein
MKSSWMLLCSVAGLGALLAVTAHAANQPCGAGCGAQTVTCVKTARVTRASCKMDCRANSTPADLGSCMRGCGSTFRASQTTCHTDHASCVQACQPAPGGSSNPACPGACGQDLGTCNHGVAAALHTCVTSCAPGPGRHACIAGCLSTAQSGAATCASDFQSCTAACGGGSPSGAFLAGPRELF